jgi:hypothetical protein
VSEINIQLAQGTLEASWYFAAQILLQGRHVRTLIAFEGVRTGVGNELEPTLPF